jgi:cytochrome c biogenesis protein CcmG/thiol:disulfide interchange protein DsbE
MSTGMSAGNESAAGVRRLIYLAPVLVFAIIAGYFVWGLNPERNPRILPSVLIDKPAPEFDLPTITGMDGPGLATTDLKAGNVVLVNFFASWCVPCRAEHPVLMALKKRGIVPIYGINYKNKADEARGWLNELGDPYTRVGADENGRVGIDWGITGVPETFVVDGGGRIRYRQWGPIDGKALEEKILPVIRKLQK